MIREGLIAQGNSRVSDEISVEFLRAQEVKVPRSLEELRQASESASAAVEQTFGNLDRLRAMKEADSEEGDENLVSSPYDAWINAALDLDEAFIDEGDGALGRQLIELVGLDDAAFAEQKEEARRLLQHTSNIALRVYPSIHRLVTLGFGASRFEVAEKLSVGDLVQQERVQNVAVTPRRKTIIGLLRDLDARLPENERTNVWSLEVSPELPPKLVVSDPFQGENKALTEYWVKHVGVARKERDVKAGMLSLSGNRTETIISDLEDIAEHATDDVLQNAARSVATWLEGKRMYYTDPEPRDFEMYHLGMEDPQQLMELMRSLDVMKHFDPEFFFELMGIDPQLGGRSPSFGSFLHKAIYNTQRAIDHASPELGEMAIRTMMNQLLTLDDRVQTYSAVVSQESLKAMAGEITKSVGEAETITSKAQTLMMMAVPYSRIAVDAEVRRQLDALREASPENMVEELRRRIDDIEHPLKLAEYLRMLPHDAHHDIRVRHLLLRILPAGMIDNGSYCKSVNFNRYATGPHNRDALMLSKVISYLYDRIPLIDESRKDLGFGLRLKVAVRDALVFANVFKESVVPNTSDNTQPRQFLKSIMPTGLFREDIEAIQDQFGRVDRQIAENFSYTSRKHVLRSSDVNEHIFAHVSHEADRAFHVGQMLVTAERAGGTENFFVTTPFADEIKRRPDLVFLSVIAHPQGKEVAFKYFDKFCEIIPAERMCELLRLPRKPVRDFEQQFQVGGPTAARPYLRYLRDQLPTTQSLFVGVPDPLRMDHIRPEHVAALIKISRVLYAGHTPWEIQTGYRRSPSEQFRIDLFDIYDALHQHFSSEGRFRPEVRDALRNPDIDPPTDEELKEMRACYKEPETSNGPDDFNVGMFQILAHEYFAHQSYTQPQTLSDRLTEDVISKIIKAKIRR